MWTNSTCLQLSRPCCQCSPMLSGVPITPIRSPPPIFILLPSCLCFYSRANCCFFPLWLTISWLHGGGGDVPPLLFDVVTNPLYCPATGKILGLQPFWATLFILKVHFCWPVLSYQLNASSFRCCPFGETCVSRYVLIRQVPDKQIKWDLCWTGVGRVISCDSHRHLLYHWSFCLGLFPIPRYECWWNHTMQFSLLQLLTTLPTC